MKICQAVLDAHAQFGGDLETMQKAYEWNDLKLEVETLRSALSAQVQDVAGLVEVVEAMARFDGRNNNAALKKMAKDALVAYRASPSAKQEGVDRSKLRPIFDDTEGRD